MKVLAITCHPDDMEIGCGGTLIKCIKRGDTVTVCHVIHITLAEKRVVMVAGGGGAICKTK